VNQFHATSVSGGRGRLKEKLKLPTVTWSQFLQQQLGYALILEQSLGGG